MENSPLRSFTVQLRSSFIPAVPRKETKNRPEAPREIWQRLRADAGVHAAPKAAHPLFPSHSPNAPTMLCREISISDSVLPTFESLIHPGNAPELPGQDQPSPAVLGPPGEATKGKTGTWDPGKGHTDLPLPDLSGGRSKPPPQAPLFV